MTVLRGVAVSFAIFAVLSWITPVQAQNGQTLNLRDADIRAFIDDVSMMTGRIFIVDPRVQGMVTVVSRDPINPDDLFQVFLSTLNVNGFAATPTATGAYKIVPTQNAGQGGGPAQSASGDVFVTEVFRLRFADANAVMNMVRPLVHPDGQVLPNRDSGALIVVDLASSMQRIRDVIAKVDRDRAAIRTIRLTNSSAAEMARTLTALTNRRGGDGADVSIVPVEANNTLLLRGDPGVIAQLVPIVTSLDAENAAKSDIRVLYLKHAVAEELVPMLEQVTRTLADETVGGPAGRASIGFDKGTNALIISASPEMQQSLESVIRQLDIARAQVQVEAIIVEVSDTAARELGVQYVLSGSEGSDVPFIVSNYSNTAPNLLALTGAVVVDQETSGESEVVDQLQETAINSLLGLNGLGLGFAGITDDGTLFGVILNALDQDTGSNVLSTPSIMTMDNQPASIIVGQEIPITTGEVLGNDNSNPFRTVERQNVGIQLDVKPQINEGDTIKLDIRQEVSAIVGPLTEASTDLVTSKREIETTVMVEDGEIIVLGGLIEQDEQVSVEKVPLLGDIPVLGRVFRSEGRSKNRTNLMVFLRPTIVRGRDDMRAVTDRKFDYIRSEQMLRSDDEPSLDVFMRDVIGPLPVN